MLRQLAQCAWPSEPVQIRPGGEEVGTKVTDMAGDQLAFFRSDVTNGDIGIAPGEVFGAAGSDDVYPNSRCFGLKVEDQGGRMADAIRSLAVMVTSPDTSGD